MAYLSKRVLLYVVLPTLFVGLSDWEARGAEPTLDEIRQQYAAHGQQLREVLVHWRTTVEVFKPDSGDYVASECRAALKDEKRFYDIRYTPVAGDPLPEEDRHRAMSYDGKETRVLGFVKHASIWPGDERHQFATPDEFLGLQGYPKAEYRLWHDERVVPCDMVELLQSGEFELAGTRKVDGAICLEVVAALDRMWLDPKRGYVMVQRELFHRATGKMGIRYSFRDIAEVQPGIWLAREIVRHTFDDAQLVCRWRLKVVKLDFEGVPDELFSLVFEPGTTVSDTRFFPQRPDGTIPITPYRIPADPADLDAVVAAAVEREGESQLTAGKSRFLPWTLVIIASVLLVIFVLVARRSVRRTS